MGALAVGDLDVGISDVFPRVPGIDGALGEDVLNYFRHRRGSVEEWEGTRE
jgi:hypothetical protein